MDNHIERIQKSIEPLRQQIINHKVYGVIRDIEDLQVFMHYHVYAVWDFMSLLKSLQNSLTCTSVPWFPKGFADTRHLINEIVLGEESDLDMDGIRQSHYELYLESMCQAGADTLPIEKFVSAVKKGAKFQEAYDYALTPEKARKFVDYTFQVINSRKNHVQAAVFTFGREDLIPGMFLSMISDLHSLAPDKIAVFKYYLERHIEIDGEHHSHLALQMTSNLCGINEDYWQEAESAALESLRKRIELWDGVYEQIVSRRKLNALY